MFHITIFIPSTENSLLFDLSMVFKDLPVEPQLIFLVLFRHSPSRPSKYKFVLSRMYPLSWYTLSWPVLSIKLSLLQPPSL